MRALVCLAALAVAALAPCDSLRGVFRPEGGSGTPWSIDAAGNLIWGGTPYAPIGLEIANGAQLDAAIKAGIKDVVIDLPATGVGWGETFKKMDAASMRYLVRIDSISPSAVGFAVDPRGYRISSIEKSRPFVLDIPGATQAYVVLANQRDGNVIDQKLIDIREGQGFYDVKVSGPGNEYVLLVYPKTSTLEMTDCWEGLDKHRDNLLVALKRNRPGPGFRGLINPLGSTVGLPGKDSRFIPTSPWFRLELRRLLEERYRTLETAVRTWALSSSDFLTYEIESEKDKGKPTVTFDDLARLVPLWNGGRGTPLLYDPETNKTFAVDQRRSQAWQDIGAAMTRAYSRRYSRLVDGIRAEADAPVLQEWAGWSGAYERNDSRLTGIAMTVKGDTPSQLAEQGARAASSLLRWSQPGWLVASRIDPGKDPATVAPVSDDLASMGARAEFFRFNEATLAAVAELSKRTVEGVSPVSAIYFPENANDPARAQRLPAGRWWLPTPVDGERLDFGKHYFGYRTENGYAIWTDTPGKTKLLMVNPKAALFQSLDGSDPAPKIVKGGVEVTLTEIPLLVTGLGEVPVPEPAVKETTIAFVTLLKANEVKFDPKVLTNGKAQDRADLTELASQFQRFLAGMDRNPGGNYYQLRDVYRDALFRANDFLWIEGESNSRNNFSEAVAVGGSSNGGALLLQSRLTNDDGFFAEYEIPVRTDKDQEVWLAARIPEGRTDDVQLLIGGQLLTISGPPVRRYGQGFGWYKLGMTKLAGANSRIRVQVPRPLGGDFAIDVILLTPVPFSPNGFVRPGE
ncbi:hypothetical protein EON79_04470 [bacterium]|nr:MAG: hypothetical protein EON79_04470 [bacterium]